MLFYVPFYLFSFMFSKIKDEYKAFKYSMIILYDLLSIYSENSHENIKKFIKRLSTLQINSPLKKIHII